MSKIWAVDVIAGGEKLKALASRALWWEAEKTLFVADVHLGKAASFRSAGFAIPRGANADELPLLRRLTDDLSARRIVILGDLWHAKAGRTEEEVGAFRAWCEAFRDVEVWLIEGNHDRRAGRLPSGCGIHELPEDTLLGPFVLRHHPSPSENGYVLAGHIHPGVLMTGRGGERLRLPCFWFGERVGVLPAFGTLTGCAAIRPKRADQVIVVAENTLVSVGARPPLFASR